MTDLASFPILLRPRKTTLIGVVALVLAGLSFSLAFRASWAYTLPIFGTAICLWVMWRLSGFGGVLSVNRVFVIGYLLYFLAPVVFFLTAGRLPVLLDPGRDLRIVCWAGFLACVAFGLVVNLPPGKTRLPRFSLSWPWNARRESWVQFVCVALSLLSLATFVVKVGGPKYYLAHLNQNGVLAAGLTYFIWGALLAKVPFLLALASPNPAKRVRKVVSYGVLSLVVLFLIGTRLFLVTTALEALIVYHLAIKRIPARLLVGAGAALLVILAVVGEYRVYLAGPHTGFVSALESLILHPQTLGDRFFNRYIDSVRIFLMIVDGIPRTFPPQHGATYLTILLQPIPSSLRPRLSVVSPGVINTFGPKGGYADVLPAFGEGYLNFGFVGSVAAFVLLGVLGRIANCFARRRGPASAILYAIFVTGLLIELRGPFTNATVYLLMDLLPIAAALAFVRVSTASKPTAVLRAQPATYRH